MSYFHTGTRTIIGAEAFHGPVRDGKEWDHLAMVIRHNFRSLLLRQLSQFAESAALAAIIRFSIASFGSKNGKYMLSPWTIESSKL